MPNPASRIGHRSSFFLLSLLFCITSLTLAPAHARKIRVDWDRNPEADIAGYVVRYGTAPGTTTGTQITDTTPSTVINGLASNTTYYIAVQAFNTSGLSSEFSEEIAIAIPKPKEPEISVELVDGTVLGSGAATFDLGTLELGSAPTARTFVLRNLGDANLKGLAVSLSDGSNFALGAIKPHFLAPGQGVGFSVYFDPETVGRHAATLRILSDDADEGDFTIGLTGTAFRQPEVVVRRSDTSGEATIDAGVPSITPTPITGPATDVPLPPDLTEVEPGTGSDPEIVPDEPPVVVDNDEPEIVDTDEPEIVDNDEPEVVENEEPEIVDNEDPEVVPDDDEVISDEETITDEEVVTTEIDPRSERGTVLAAREIAAEATAGQRPVRTTVVVEGRKYRALIVPKVGKYRNAQPRHVCVSGDLVDWSSGQRHTETIRNNPRFMIVRDRRPATSSRKRYIRVHL